MSNSEEIYNSSSQNVMSRLNSGMAAAQRRKEGIFDNDARVKAAITSENENRAAEGEGGVGGGSGAALAIGAIRSAVKSRMGAAFRKKALGTFKDVLDQRKNAQTRGGEEDNGTQNDTIEPPETSEGGTQTSTLDSRPNIDLQDIDQSTRQPLTETETAGEGESGVSDSFQSALDDATQEAGKGFEPTPLDDDQPLSELTDFTKDDPTKQDVGTDLGGDENLGDLVSEDAINQITSLGGYKKPPTFEEDTPTTTTEPATTSLDEDEIQPAPPPPPPTETPTPATTSEPPTTSLDEDEIRPAPRLNQFDDSSDPVSSLTDDAPSSTTAELTSQTESGGLSSLKSMLSNQGMNTDDIGSLLKGLGSGDDLTDVLSAGADMFGGGSSSLLGTIGGGLLDALGPVGALGGAIAGIWSAVSSDDALETATKNAKSFQNDVTYLSATPQLSTGSIAMPTMDTTSFRSGGLSNF